MIYYAVAVTATLLLSHFFSTVYTMPNGGRISTFQNSLTAFLVILPLTFVAVTRWDVGVDSLYGESYWTAYHAAAEGLNPREFEPGFFWFMRMLSSMKVPFFWVLFIHGILFAVMVSIALARGSVWTTWSILIFFLLFMYFDSYSSLRQSLAEAMCLIAWADMGYSRPSTKRDIRILAIFLLSAMLHTTGLINIPLYLICKFRFSRKTLLKAMIFALIITPVFQQVLPLLMQLVAGDRYEPIGFARINAALSFALFILCWYYYDEISALDENAYTYVNLSLCIFVIFMNSNVLYLPYRIFDMTKIGYVLIIPILLRSIPKRETSVYIQFGLLVLFGTWFVNAFFLQDSFVTDYQSALEDWSYITNLP